MAYKCVSIYRHIKQAVNEAVKQRVNAAKSYDEFNESLTYTNIIKDVDID